MRHVPLRDPTRAPGAVSHQAGLAVTLALSLLLGSSPSLAQHPVRIRLGTLAPQGTTYHRILQEMGEQWRVRTNGRVQLTVYAGTMGSESELVRRARLGQLQAATLTVTGLREIDPGVSALQQMPMMFRTLEEAAYVRDKLAPTLAARLAERGFRVLFWGDAGWVRYFTKVPAQRPDDFRKLKIFVTAGDTKQFDLMKSAGYPPVALEYTDALTALQTGMIDAVPTVPFHALAAQFYTVAPHMLELNWLPLVGATIISQKTWDAIPADVQAAIQEAADEAGRKFEARGREEQEESIAAMKKRGLKVVPVPAAVEAEWRAVGESFYPQLRGGMVPADMFDEVVRILKEYRSSRPGG